MPQPRTLRDWLTERNLSPADLADRAKLDVKVVEAILAGRYTTAPRHRARIAAALELAESDIKWSTALEVDHMYGHGPQFGRSP